MCGAASMPPRMPASSIGISEWVVTANHSPSAKGRLLIMASRPAIQKVEKSRARISKKRAAPFFRGASGETPGPGLSKF